MDHTTKTICSEEQRDQRLTITEKDYFILSPGKTSKPADDVIKNVLKRVSGQPVSNVEKCNAILVFCFIVSRAGTDTDAALNELKALSESKTAVFMVLHHTFDPEKIVLDSSRYVTRVNTLTVDCFFNEDEGLLECVKNDEALSKIQQWLQPQDTQAKKVISASKLIIVLLGTSGPDKTAVEHMILGREKSQADISPVTQTKITVNTGAEDGVAVINTPDWFSSGLSPAEIRLKIQFCINQISQKPYTLLLVIPVKQFIEKEREIEEKIYEIFQDRERPMILFTATNEQEEKLNVQQFTKNLGIKFHFLNINQIGNYRSQVSELLKKVEEIATGKGKCTLM